MYTAEAVACPRCGLQGVCRADAARETTRHKALDEALAWHKEQPGEE